MLGLLAAAGSGCGGGDVWVGQFQEGLNLDECAGTDCASATTHELTTPEPRTCGGARGPELAVDFSVAIPEPECPDDDGFCQHLLSDLAVAPDGSSWVLLHTVAYSSDTHNRLRLSHFSSEGALLGTNEVAVGVPFNGGTVIQVADLATDARGHAFVLIYQLDPGANADAPLAEQAWLTELDPSGEQVNGPMPFAGIAAGKLAVRADGNIMLAANAPQTAPRSVVAALTTTGEKLWSRADLATAGYTPEGAIDGLAVDALGSAFVFAKRVRAAGNDYTVGLTRYDAAGNVVWDRHIDRHLAFSWLGDGADGGVLISGQTLDAKYWMSYVRDDATAAWAYWTGSDATGVIDAERDRVYVPSADPSTMQDELLSIALDGESCVRYGLPRGAYGLPRLDGQGRLYLIGDHELVRLRLPDE